MPLWCSYVTWRVCVCERENEWPFPPDWFLQNHTLIKCIHLVVADNNTMRVCFVNNLNQTLRECLYLCTQMWKRTVCGVFTRLWGHWWPLITSPQSESLVVCEVDEDLVKKLKEFRFRKETNNAAIISEFYMSCWDRASKWTSYSGHRGVNGTCWALSGSFLSWFKQMLWKHLKNLTYIMKGGKKKKCRTQHKSSRWCGWLHLNTFF